MDGVVQWLQQLELDWLYETIVVAVASLLCIIIHEISHGFAAYCMGDTTAKKQGRLSLNPLRHIDPAGLLMMIVFKFGWAKPVAVDPRYFKNPKLGMAITALAGPLSNVILTFVALLIRIFVLLPAHTQGGIWEYMLYFLEYVAILSAGLCVFNLFPIPPLDGSKILFAVLPNRIYFTIMRYEHFGMIVLAVLLLTNVLDVPLMLLRSGLVEGLNSLVAPLFDLLV